MNAPLSLESGQRLGCGLREGGLRRLCIPHPQNWPKDSMDHTRPSPAPPPPPQTTQPFPIHPTLANLIQTHPVPPSLALQGFRFYKRTRELSMCLPDTPSIPGGPCWPPPSLSAAHQRPTSVRSPPSIPDPFFQMCCCLCVQAANRTEGKNVQKPPC